jgi:hypothetical protein
MGGAPLPPFGKAEIVAFRKELIADHPDLPPPADMLAVFDRWEKHADEWEHHCWPTIAKRLPANAMPTVEEVFWWVLHRRAIARRIAEIIFRSPTTAQAKRRAEAYLRDKTNLGAVAQAAAELTYEYAVLTELAHKLAQFGRQKENIEKKLFIVWWRNKFFELCGKPLDEVVRVLTEIVYGGTVNIGVIRGVGRPTTRIGRKRDTQLPLSVTR